MTVRKVLKRRFDEVIIVTRDEPTGYGGTVAAGNWGASRHFVDVGFAGDVKLGQVEGDRCAGRQFVTLGGQNGARMATR